MSTLEIVVKLDNQAGELKAIKGEIVNLGEAGEKASSGLAKLQVVGAMGWTAVATAVGAATAAIASSIGIASKFQDNVTILAIAAKGAGESFDSMRDAAIAVGGDTSLVGVSAAGAADAMTTLYKAGLTTGEIFGDLNGYLAGNVELSGALRAAIDGAAASELSMEQAADLAAVTLATFGSEMKTTEERAQFVNVAMNNFVQSADASMASVGDLYAAMKNIGPTAAQFGFSLQDTNTALAILSMRGISGAEAGTALKSMMNNLMRTTPAVTGALKELNVSLYNSDGTMRELPQIVDDLSRALYGSSDATSGLTEQQRNQYIATLAGTYGMKSLAVLLMEGTEGWTAMEKAIASAATIQEVASARAATFSGVMEALDGVIETIRIGIGSAFLPVLTTLARVMGDMSAEAMPMIIDSFEAFGGAVAALVESVLSGEGPLDSFASFAQTLASALGMTTEQAQRVHDVIRRVGEILKQILTPIAEVITSFFSWKDVLVALGIAMAAAATYVVAAIAGLFAPLIVTIFQLVAVIAILRNAWENNFLGIRTAVETFAKGFGDAFTTIRQTLKDGGSVFDALKAGLPKLGEAAKEAGRIILGHLAAAFAQLKETVFTWVAAVDWNAVGQTIIKGIAAVSGIREMILKKMGDLKEAIFTWAGTTSWSEVGKTILGNIADGFRNLGDKVAGIEVVLLSWITKAIDGINWNATGQLLIRGIATAIGAAVGLLVTAGTAIISYFSGFFSNPDLGPAAKNIVRALGNALVELAGGMGDALSPLVSAIGDAIHFDEIFDKIKTAVQPVVNIFAPTVERIKEAFGGLKDNMAPVGDKLLELEDAFIKLGVALMPVYEAFQGLALKIASGLQTVLVVVGGILGGLIAILSKFLGETLASIISNAGQIFGGLVSVVTGLVTLVTGLIQGLVGIVRGIIDGDWTAIWTSAAAALQTMVEGAKLVLSGLWQFISGILKSIWDAVVNTVNDLVGTTLPKWDEFKIKIIEKFTEIKTAISDKVASWKQSFTDFVENVRTLNIGETIKAAIAGKLDEIAQSIRTKVTEWTEVIKGWGAAAKAAIVAWGAELVTSVRGKFGEIKAAIANIDWHQVGYDIGYKVTSFFLNVLVGVPLKIASTLVSWYKAFSTWVSSTDWNGIATKIVTTITDGLKDFVKKVGDTLKTWSAAFTDWVRSSATKLKQVGTDVIAAIITGLREFPQKAKENISGWISTFTDWVRNTASQLKDVGAKVIDNIKTGLAEFPTKAQDALSRWATVFSSWVSDKKEQLKKVGLDVIEKVKTGLAEFPEKARATLETWITAFATWVGSKVEAFKLLGSAIVTHIKSGLVDFWEKAKETVEGWYTSIMGWVGGKAESFKGIGTSMIDGIISGIQGMGEAIVSAATGVVQGAWDAVRNIFGIHSPSTLFATGVGMPISQGIALGITEGAKSVIDAITGLAGEAELAGIKSFTEAMKGIGEAISGAIQAYVLLAGFGKADAAGADKGLASITSFMAAMVEGFVEINDYSEETLGLVGQFAETASKMMDMLSGSLVPLRTLAQIDLSFLNSSKLADGVLGLRDFLAGLVGAFAEAASELGIFGPLVKEFIEAASGVVDMVGGGLKAAVLLSGFNFDAAVQGWHLRDQIVTFRNIVRSMVREFADAALEFSYMSEAVKTFSEAAGSVIGLVETGIAAVTTLSEVDFGKLVSGWHLRDQIITFRNIVRSMVREFADAAVEFGYMGDSVKAFSDAAGSVIGLVETGIAAVTALSAADFGKLVDGWRLRDQIVTFRNIIRSMVREFADAAGEFSTMGDSVLAFTSAAEAVVGLVGPALEAIEAIADYSLDTSELAPKLSGFTADLYYVVTNLAIALDYIAQQFGEVLESGGAMSQAAQEVLGAIEPGVSALAALNEYSGRIDDLEGRLSGFTADLYYVVTNLAVALDYISQQFGEVLTNAAEFADGATSVLDVISPAIEALTALAEYTSAAAIDTKAKAFTDDLLIVLQVLVEGLTRSTLAADDALAQAAEMAGNISGLMDVVRPGIEALTALAKYTATANLDTKARQFTDDLIVAATILTAGLTAAVNSIGGPALDASRQFASDVSEIVGSVKDALSGLGEIGALPRPDIKPALKYVIDAAGQIQRAFSSEGDIGAAVDYATTFRQNLTELVQGVQQAVALIGVLAGTGTSGNIAAALAVVVTSVENTANQFIGAGRMLAEALIDALVDGIQGGTGLVVSAVLYMLDSAQSAAVIGGGKVGRSAVESINTQLGDGRSMMANSGALLGQSLLSGMTNALAAGRSSLVNSVANTMNAAVTSARGTLGIASPSKVSYQMGSDWMTGFKNALEDKSASLNRIARDVMGGVSLTGLPQVQPAAPSGDTYYVNEYDMHFTVSAQGSDARSIAEEIERLFNEKMRDLGHTTDMRIKYGY